MEQEAMKQHGTFSWNELMTTDIAGAKSFYKQMFGWEMQDEKTPDMIYTMLKTGDKEVGGMMAIPTEAKDEPPSWGAYVTVDDVDQQIIKAEKLGGQVILQPKDIPNVGRFAVIRDPQGAVLTLITYSC